MRMGLLKEWNRIKIEMKLHHSYGMKKHSSIYEPLKDMVNKIEKEIMATGFNMMYRQYMSKHELER